MYCEQLWDVLSNAKNCIGYSDEELVTIERLYDISIEGALKIFLCLAGRSTGDVFLGDEFSPLYSPVMSVRDHVFYQEGRREVLSEDVGKHELVLQKPFFFAEPGFIYFILTRPRSPEAKDIVFKLDEDSARVELTESTFCQFLLKRIKNVRLNPPKIMVKCVGELIKI